MVILSFCYIFIKFSPSHLSPLTSYTAIPHTLQKVNKDEAIMLHKGCRSFHSENTCAWVCGKRGGFQEPCGWMCHNKLQIHHTPYTDSFFVMQVKKGKPYTRDLQMFPRPLPIKVVDNKIVHFAYEAVRIGTLPRGKDITATENSHECPFSGRLCTCVSCCYVRPLVIPMPSKPLHSISVSGKANRRRTSTL
jgi:hypothetical protein